MLSWGYVVPVALLVCLGTVYPASTNKEDERTIRGMVDQAVARLNVGDVTALDDFWDENADYVGVDGTLIKGRAQMRGFFRKMGESSTGHQIASVEQIRFRPTFSPHSSRYWTSSRRASVARAPVVVLMGHPVLRNTNVLNQKRFLIAPSIRFTTRRSSTDPRSQSY